MIDIQKEAEKFFGKTSGGKGVVTLADCIKFAEIVRDKNKQEWRDPCDYPEHWKSVLLLRNCSSFAVGFYDEIGRIWCEIDGAVISPTQKPTHWMPLPELPEIDK